MDLKPTPRIIVIFQIGVIFFFFFLSAPLFICFLFGKFLLLLLSERFREHVPALARLLFGLVFFGGIVFWGRILGARAGAEEILYEGICRVSILFLVVAMSSLIYLYHTPAEALRFFDTLRLPRSMSYVLLSIVTLQANVRNSGRRQLYLLKLKGMGPESFRTRIFAYYRIVGPLFWGILNRQMIQARSLGYRGFFSAPILDYPIRLSGINNREIVWASLIMGYYILWIVVGSILGRSR